MAVKFVRENFQVAQVHHKNLGQVPFQFQCVGHLWAHETVGNNVTAAYQK